jgi:hypothetical protein
MKLVTKGRESKKPKKGKRLGLGGFEKKAGELSSSAFATPHHLSLATAISSCRGLAYR